MFCWFYFARFLRLSLDRSWAIVHPSRKQSQPPAYFAALLVKLIVGASAVPIVSHLKPLAHFTGFLWELRRQPRLPSVRQTPLATFGATFFGTAKIQTFWADFAKMLLKAGKLWSVLHFLRLWVAEFCGNSAEGGRCQM